MVRFSLRAESDLSQIIQYTIQSWGQLKADHYLLGIHKICQRLECMPNLGRHCDEVRTGLLRIEYGRHVIFYRLSPVEDVLIVRILHQNMLPGNYGMGE